MISMAANPAHAMERMGFGVVGQLILGTGGPGQVQGLDGDGVSIALTLGYGAQIETEESKSHVRTVL